MIKSRNQSAHTYNEGMANAITDNILNIYYGLFEEFATKMQTLTDQP